MKAYGCRPILYIFRKKTIRIKSFRITKKNFWIIRCVAAGGYLSFLIDIQRSKYFSLYWDPDYCVHHKRLESPVQTNRINCSHFRRHGFLHGPHHGRIFHFQSNVRMNQLNLQMNSSNGKKKHFNLYFSLLLFYNQLSMYISGTNSIDAAAAAAFMIKHCYIFIYCAAAIFYYNTYIEHAVKSYTRIMMMVN